MLDAFRSLFSGVALVVLLGAAPVVPVITSRDAVQLLRDVVVKGVVSATLGGRHQPIPGASVELVDLSKDPQHQIVASVTTGADGAFAFTNPSRRAAVTFADIPPGTYRLFASFRGVREPAAVVVATADTTLTKNVELGTIGLAGAASPMPATAFFVTDRSANAGATTLGALFANGRLIDPCTTAPDCATSYGMVAAANGSLLAPTSFAHLAGLTAQMQAMPQYAAATSVIVYVHGFNTPFEDPVNVGATWLASFDPAQPVIVYSWPSNNKLDKYFDDETNNTWSQDHFRDFMLALLNDPGAPKTVNLLAHSMGNRLAVGFLDYLARAAPVTTGHMGQVIFAAPDVDSATFFEAIPRISTIATGLTLYGSSHDEALRASRALHGHCRAGLVGCDYAVPAVKNFNAIDTSFFHCDLLGHGYWLSSDTIHADIESILRSGTMDATALRSNVVAGSTPSTYAFTSGVPGDRTCDAAAAPSS